MKKIILLVLLGALVGCDKESATSTQTSSATGAKNPAPAEPPAAANTEPAVVAPSDGPKNIVNVAVGSKDHTTLVTALKAADYVDSLTNPGPFTVFAPTNAAFDKLPKGTVEGLLKPEKNADLKDVLKYHVAVSVYPLSSFKDGQVMAMANGSKVTFHVKDGKVLVNDAAIVASIPASNGIIHVIDGVLLPPAK
ncbi:MAG TPA: fasciclin domain-containing protein [Labilithrix sp.]|nr:fasciclin domain-containing protein [Labilithrix sp.]